ncbi:MAG TPA: SurA N-terminal domain-containing protein, partial [Candidatus Polarisedimenticolia bacterium]|nr:SurA N-terminal domain-containing protein [Candidatus Polarisedimenticolia bacterium]
MLRQMREWFSYLKWLLVVIVFMFIWWAFASWGGGTSSRRPTATWAARVNGEEIPVARFQSYARQIDSTYQAILGEQYAQQRAFLKIGQRAINDLVEQELVYQEAMRQGITVTPREVTEAITRDPRLQENGQFIGLARYRSLFREDRLSLADFEEQIRHDLVIEKLRSLVEDAVTVSDPEVEQEFLKRNQKSTVEYVIISPDRLRRPGGPSEAEVARYYEEHKDRYSKGEGRSGVYVLFSPADLAATRTVSDDEVRAAYERDRNVRYTVPDQRRASHILFKVAAGADAASVGKIEGKARDVLRRAKAGEDFAALARKYSEDTGSAKNGGDLNFFGRKQMVPEFEAAAFALPIGGVSDLVRTSFGFHIIKVTETRAGRTVPFEEVRDALREELKSERARGEIVKRSADFARAAAGGKLEAVARSQGLPVRQTGTVHEGEALPDLAASQPVVARMLS